MSDIQAIHNKEAGETRTGDPEPVGVAVAPQMPEAGDTDPSSTRSSEETGQGGVNDRPGKDTGKAWNG